MAAVGGTEARRLTEGDFDLFSLRWRPGGSELLLTGNRGDLQQRLAYRVPVAGGPMVPITSRPGTYSIDEVSSDGARAVVHFSGPGTLPEFLLVDLPSQTQPVLVAATRAPDLAPGDLANVEAVAFRSNDGSQVRAVLITPKGMRRDVRHPALVNMYGGWGQRAALQGASAHHNYLVKNGYLVLVVDPRGSEGYGETFAKGLYRDAGGKQSEDLAAAAAYLRTQPFVDPNGVAIHGHSYSGWLALWTMIHSPDAFNAGIAGAQSGWSVNDATRSYGTYSVIRWGLPHEADNQLSARNPALQIARLKAPVFIVHGTADINVPISTSERVVKALIAARKEFDYMVYPGEPHGWSRFDTNVDFYKRTVSFLNRHLRAHPGPAPAQ